MCRRIVVSGFRTAAFDYSSIKPSGLESIYYKHVAYATMARRLILDSSQSQIMLGRRRLIAMKKTRFIAVYFELAGF
jgi:hypothetical protein